MNRTPEEAAAERRCPRNRGTAGECVAAARGAGAEEIANERRTEHVRQARRRHADRHASLPAVCRVAQDRVRGAPRGFERARLSAARRLDERPARNGSRHRHPPHVSERRAVSRHPDYAAGAKGRHRSNCRGAAVGQGLRVPASASESRERPGAASARAVFDPDRTVPRPRPGTGERAHAHVVARWRAALSAVAACTMAPISRRALSDDGVHAGQQGRIKDLSSPWPTGLGVGVSKALPGCSPLPDVAAELRIIRIPPPTRRASCVDVCCWTRRSPNPRYGPSSVSGRRWCTSPATSSSGRATKRIPSSFSATAVV